MEQMARRISIALVALLALLADTAPAQTIPPSSSSILVQYGFDDNELETGPDTFAVFQQAKGSVRLTTQNRFSGYRSIEIRDVAGDGAFPELQGYFQLRTHGKLYLHFALMTTNPVEEFNIALAGPEWFSLRKNGIGFWLKTIDGYLCHYSDSMPKKLFPMLPFVWYIVNAVYDVDSGSYDLAIQEEGRTDPIVSLKNQPNAPKQAGSVVDKFSFIGDHNTDQSNVVYYVDDVVVGVDESVTQLPFVAPGRRKLFIDYWIDNQRSLRARPRSLPVIDFSDLGIRPQHMLSLRAEGLSSFLEQIVAGRLGTVPDRASAENRRLLQAVVSWRAGHDALNDGQAAVALARFEDAARLVPEGKIYAMGAVLSLAALGRWVEVDTRLDRIYPDWRDDIRFPAAVAMIGTARLDLAQAEQWLRFPAEQVPNVPKTLLADQYFYVLLWQKQFTQARQFAEGMVDRNRELGISTSIWIERLGDAAFMSGDPGTALLFYEESLGTNKDHPATRLLLKLSDVYFRLGDLDKERFYREMIYGRLSY
jgi:tetratricopeptide (TPR) repeat protein